MKVNFAGFGLISGILVYGIYSTSVNAQVIPDATLKTSVSQSGNNFTITNGDRVGNNLFHSFSQFSIPSKGSAFFNNAADIQNIFSRVTGGSLSNIDGLIQANGTANLFLLNPSGILFGPNASLNIGGSFVGTTANSIKFADGVEFSAANATSPPLLTISVPIGLQMGQNPGVIQNASMTPNPIPSDLPFLIPGGLQVQPEKSLILLGGDVFFEGGAATALHGQIAVGGVGANSFVTLLPRDFGFELNYDQVQIFRDVRLDHLSVLDARDGGVQVQGRHIDILNGSFIDTSLLQATSSRGITINATESLSVSGSTTVETVEWGPILWSASLWGNVPFGGAGNVGDITLQAPVIVVSDGADVSTQNGDAGQGGNIVVQANRLILQGGAIGTSTIGTANAGDLTIHAADVQIGSEDLTGRLSVLTTASVITTGHAGTITLQTDRLRIINDGLIASSTFGSGDAGDTIIHASDFVEIVNTNENRRFPSGIHADGLLAQFSLFGISPNLSGDGGNVEITTGNLILQGFSTISVGNPGRGDAGNLTINAQAVTLNGGSLSAEIASGGQGNIQINADVLLMRHGGSITTNAASQANGGNISINAPVIVGLENSDIIANAVQGRGGSLDITTQGMIGLKFRNTLTPRADLTNDITASSTYGVNGTVDINNFGVDPSSGLVELPANLVEPSQQIAAGCSNTNGSSFVATGRGGVPQNPNQQVTSDRPWSDIRDLSAYRKTHSVQAQIPKSPETLVQATGWYRNARGKIELVADKSSTQGQQSLTCAAIPQN